MSDPLDIQIGGNHYKNLAIQPIEYVLANDLGPCEASVIKYVTRWRTKGGLEDLRKAKHYLELLIAHELKQQAVAQSVMVDERPPPTPPSLRDRLIPAHTGVAGPLRGLQWKE